MKTLTLILTGTLMLATTSYSKTLVDTAASNLPSPQLQARGHYVVAISESAQKRPGWFQAARILKHKYNGEILTYRDRHLLSLLPELKKRMPHYVCFVAPPDQIGRTLIVLAHRMMRQLDADPYTDAFWGVLTGYTAEDAQRIARLEKPLVISRAASSMGPGLLGGLQSGFASDEANRRNFWSKRKGMQRAEKESLPEWGIAERLARAFNTQPVDLFITSGHASERDWQIIYNVNAGGFRHDRGRLYAFSPASDKRYYFTSPSTKVYIPAGNCLIGHIDGQDCMATSWMHSGGVSQMVGYTVVTFYGFMGWGTKAYFDDAGHTLSEAFFSAEQALLLRIGTNYPKMMGLEPTTYGINTLAGEIKRKTGSFNNDMLGLLWDRDTVAFYGDPAWQARYDFSRRAVDYRLDQEGKRWTLTGTFRRDVSFLPVKHRDTRPLLYPFPVRIPNPQLVAGSTIPKGSVVTDIFAMIPFEGKKRKGESFTLTFTSF